MHLTAGQIGDAPNQFFNCSFGPEFSGTCPIDAPPKHFTQFFVKLNMRKVSLVIEFSYSELIHVLKKGLDF